MISRKIQDLIFRNFQNEICIECCRNIKAISHFPECFGIFQEYSRDVSRAFETFSK